MPRTVESLEGYIECIEGYEAAVLLFEDGHPQEHVLPSCHLTDLGLRSGDSFWFDVVEEDDGSIKGKFRPWAVDHPLEPPGLRPEKSYLGPDQIDALASDAW